MEKYCMRKLIEKILYEETNGEIFYEETNGEVLYEETNGKILYGETNGELLYEETRDNYYENIVLIMCKFTKYASDVEKDRMR